MKEPKPLKQKTYTCLRCGKRFVGRQDFCPRCGQPHVYEQKGVLYNSMGDQVKLSRDKKRLIVVKPNQHRPR